MSLSVTVSDPASTQKAWGFQLTARPSSSSNTQAGSFASTDQKTLLMCASSSLFTEQEVDYSAGKTQTCPSSMTLQYIEHSLAGYSATKGQSGSGTYEFDWNPPSTSAGDIVLYVAGNAANGDLTTSGDHIYTNTYTLTPAAGGSANKPVINSNGVVNYPSYQPGVVPGSFVSIFGTNLASSTKSWDSAIVNGQLPTAIDGVSVSIGGKPAYINFISPSQINVQAPDVGLGPMPVTVTNSGVTSDPVTVTSQQFGPAFFLANGSKYAVAQRYPDYVFSANPSVIPGMVAAKPGDILILWGSGFGPTNPAVPAGQVPPPTGPGVTGGGVPVTVTVGGVNAQLISAVLSAYVADYQVAIQLPSSLPNGDIPIKASIGSYQTPDNVYIYVQN